MEKINYGIDIELPDGVVIGQSAAEVAAQHAEHAIDIELPEGVIVTDDGIVESALPPQKEEKVFYGKRKQHMGMKKKDAIFNTIIHIVLVIMSIIWLMPFVFIVIESLRVKPTDASSFMGDGNIKFGFDNYVKLFTKTDFPRWLLNTFLIGLAVAVFQTIIVLSVSYALSRMRFKGRKGLMNFMLILGMFPGFLTMVLLYKVLSDFKLTQSMTPVGLILVYTASSGMGYYISKGFFDTIPRSLDEAARVDGATRAQVLIKVILPMAKPIVIYTVLMAFMAPWGDFIFAKFLARSTSSGMNVAAGLQNMLASPGEIGKNFTVFCAGGVITAIPITALFLFLQKYYVAGVTGGAVKG